MATGRVIGVTCSWLPSGESRHVRSKPASNKHGAIDRGQRRQIPRRPEVVRHALLVLHVRVGGSGEFVEQLPRLAQPRIGLQACGFSQLGSRGGRRFRERLTRQGGKRGEFIGRLLRAEVDDARKRHGGRARLLADRREHVGQAVDRRPSA